MYKIPRPFLYKTFRILLKQDNELRKVNDKTKLMRMYIQSFAKLTICEKEIEIIIEDCTMLSRDMKTTQDRATKNQLQQPRF